MQANKWYLCIEGKAFRVPAPEDLKDVHVVVATLSTCYSLLQLKLPEGEYTTYSHGDFPYYLY